MIPSEYLDLQFTTVTGRILIQFLNMLLHFFCIFYIKKDINKSLYYKSWANNKGIGITILTLSSIVLINSLLLIRKYKATWHTLDYQLYIVMCLYYMDYVLSCKKDCLNYKKTKFDYLKEMIIFFITIALFVRPIFNIATIFLDR